jgi:phosphoribosylformimino-5-aminoimidazole carboxamide ribotide isomerase
MDVIPVIDIKNGQVVHAHGGKRESYHPIDTPLSPTSAPSDVVGGLLRLHSFRTLYVADLDAIEKRGSNLCAIEALSTAYPELELWIDNGMADAQEALEWLRRTRFCLVIGSESQHDDHTARALQHEKRVLMSLDFRGDKFQGPPGLQENASLWPSRVIVMTLGRVGSGSGPDTMRIAEVASRANGARIFGAGGVRDATDLEAISEAGATGVLVATALHDGTLTSADLHRHARPDNRA